MLENRSPLSCTPWWVSPATHIANSPEEAGNAHDIRILCHDQDSLDIYTDGSGIDGQTEAAAACPSKEANNSSTAMHTLNGTP